MSQPKLHHWWPQFHQRYWADAQGRIFQIRKDKAFATGPRSNAAIRDDNTITMPDGTKNVAVEEWFSQHVEGPAAAAFAVLSQFAGLPQREVDAPPGSERIGGVVNGRARIRDLQLGADHRRAIGRYLAAMVIRVPSYRYQISGVLASLRQRAREERGVNIPEPSLTEDRNNQIHWMMQHLEDFALVFAGSFWMAFESPAAEPFLFGDTPVLPYTEPNGRLSLVVPLLPRLALSVMRGPAGNPINEVVPVISCGKVLADDWNDKSIRQSRDAVFSDRQPTPELRQAVTANLSTAQPQIGAPPEGVVRRWLDEL